MDRCRMGHFCEQPQGQILRDYQKRPETNGRTRRPLAASFRCDGPRACDARRSEAVKSRLQEALNRLRCFVRRKPLENELDAEMDAHLDFAIEENLRRGLSPREARRQALINFGGVEQAKEQHRENRGIPALDILTQDVRYAFRTLRRDRAFALVAVLILALGIGANITVFSVANTILLRPLPFQAPEQLAWLAGNNGAGGLSDQTYEVDVFETIQRESQSFSNVTAYVPYYDYSDFILTGYGEPRSVPGVGVAGNFFQALGITLKLGRSFTREECVKGGPPAVILTKAIRRRQFAADPAIVGRAITLNSRAFTVAGVLDDNFDFGAVFAPGLQMDVFVPVILDEIRTYGHMLSVIGRLKPGVEPG